MFHAGQIVFRQSIEDITGKEIRLHRSRHPHRKGKRSRHCRLPVCSVALVKLGAGFPVVTVLARFVVSLTPSLKLSTGRVQHGDTPQPNLSGFQSRGFGGSESLHRGFRVTLIDKAALKPLIC